MTDMHARKTLSIVYYSQGGQTARAVEQLEAIVRSSDHWQLVGRLNLGELEAVRTRFKTPWQPMDFIQAQPAAFAGEMELGAVDDAAVLAADVIVIAYPVWFMAPAIPISAWLKQLGGRLRGKTIVSVSTCRQMWLGAQRMLRELVEQQGGFVLAHAALQDTSPSWGTMLSTPNFFLTGRRHYEHSYLREKIPVYGIPDSQYQQFEQWFATLLSTPELHASLGAEFNDQIALFEYIGRKLSVLCYSAWGLVEHGPAAPRNAYASVVAVITVLSIISLRPWIPTIGRVPFVARTLRRVQREVLSPSAASQAW